MYKINPKSPEIRNKVISKIIMKENCEKNPFYKCEMCYTLLPRKENLYKHIWKYHDNENLGKQNPYVWLSDNCVIGCGFASSEKAHALHYLPFA